MILWTALATMILAQQGKFLIVSGDVKIKTPKGNFHSVQVSDTISPPITIMTGQQSRAKIVWNDENVSHILPDSIITIKRYNLETKQVEFVVHKGDLRNMVFQRYQIDKKEYFRVKTPHVVAGVRGTDFVVSHRNSQTQVLTFEGRVWVTPLRVGSLTKDFILEAGEKLQLIDQRIQKTFLEPQERWQLDQDTQAQKPTSDPATGNQKAQKDESPEIPKPVTNPKAENYKNAAYPTPISEKSVSKTENPAASSLKSQDRLTDWAREQRIQRRAREPHRNPSSFENANPSGNDNHPNAGQPQPGNGSPLPGGGNHSTGGGILPINDVLNQML